VTVEIVGEVGIVTTGFTVWMDARNSLNAPVVSEAHPIALRLSESTLFPTMAELMAFEKRSIKVVLVASPDSFETFTDFTIPELSLWSEKLTSAIPTGVAY
jgi:hypothetical protein